MIAALGRHHAQDSSPLAPAAGDQGRSMWDACITPDQVQAVRAHGAMVLQWRFSPEASCLRQLGWTRAAYTFCPSLLIRIPTLPASTVGLYGDPPASGSGRSDAVFRPMVADRPRCIKASTVRGSARIGEPDSRTGGCSFRQRWVVLAGQLVS